ncbi:MAG: putative Ig domain-containing protein, partial [Candidatus Latescibacterota bacterium]
NSAPQLAAIGDQTVGEGQTLSLVLSATDADGNPVTYAVSGNPSGSALSGSTFTWTPSYAQAGTYTITFTAADGRGGSDSKTVTITVTDTNRVPVLAAIGPKSVAEGGTLAFALSASDPDGDAVSYSALANPTGSVLTGSVFAWTPASGQAGSYPVTFSASDSKGGSASETVTITVTAPTPVRSPVTFDFAGTIESVTVPGAAVGPGAAYTGSMTFDAAAADQDARPNIGYFDPFDLAMQVAIGSYSFRTKAGGRSRLSITDNIDNLDLCQWESELEQVAGPTIAAIRLVGLVHLVSVDLGAVTSDHIPTTPPDLSRFAGYCWVDVYSSGGAAPERLYAHLTSLSLPGSSPPTPTNRAPVLAAIGARSVTAGIPLNLVLSASDADGDALTYSVSGNPAGSVLTGAAFNWTPGDSQVGAYTVTFSVADGKGGSDSKAVTITVSAAAPPVLTNSAPRWSVAPAPTVAVGDTLRLQLQATDPDGDIVHYLVTSSPAGATLTGNQFVWRPAAQDIGRVEVTFTASDLKGGNASQPISITVSAPPPRVSASPALLDFGSVEIGQRDTLSIRVVNQSLQSLSSYTFSAPRGFVVTPASLTLAAGTEQTVRVIFAPSGTERFDTVFTLNFDVTYAEVSLRGLGVVANRPPIPRPVAGQAVAEGDTLRLAVVAEDADGDTVRWVLQSGPPEMVLVGNVVIWAPGFDAAGSYQVVLSATDGRSPAVPLSVALTVTNTNRSPVVTRPGAVSATAGDTVIVDLVARDPDGEAITAAVLGGAPGASLQGLRFTWPTTRSLTGLFAPSIVVTDASGDTAVTQLSIRLAAPVVLPPRLEVQTTLLDFDVVALGQSSRTRKVPVHNAGGSPLELYDLSLSEPTFRVIQQDSLPLVIAPGATRFLELTFRPAAVGVVRGDLALYSNDTQLPEFVVRLRGEGQQLGAFEPCMITQRVLFGATAQQQTAPAILLVRNQGALDGQVRVVPDDPAIVSGEAIYPVASGAVVSIDLTLDLAARRASSGRIILETTPATREVLQVGWKVQEYLELVDTDPVDGATDVPLKAELVLYFSAPLAVVGDQPVLDVRLQPLPLSGAVDRAVRVSSSGRVVTLPVELAANTVYEVVVLGAEGRAGQQLGGRIRQRFTTGSAPLMNGAISGQVLNGEVPATVARVYLADAGKQVTDETEVGPLGRYAFDAVPIGSYQLFAREPSSQVSASFDADGDGVGDLLSVRAGQRLDGIDLQLELGEAPAPGDTTEVGVALSLDLDPAAGDQAVTTTPVAAGETVTVSLHVQGATALTGFLASLEFDSTQVQLVRVREDGADERCLLYRQGGTPLFLQSGSEYAGALLAPSTVTAVDSTGLLAVWTLRTTASFAGQTEVTLGPVSLKSLTGSQVLQPSSRIVLRLPQSAAVTSPIRLDLDLAPGDQGSRERSAAGGSDIAVQLVYTGQTPLRGYGVQLSYDPRLLRVPLAEFSPDQAGWLPVVRSLADGQAEMGAALLSGTMSQAELGILHVHVDSPLTGNVQVILRRVTLSLANGQEFQLEVDERVTLRAGGSPGDFNGDDHVDFSDFFLFADAFGSPDFDPLYDLNSDGGIDFADFFVFADLFGQPQRAKLMVLAHQYLGLPAASGLESAYPSPFNAATTIRYRLSEPGPVRLVVYG